MQAPDNVSNFLRTFGLAELVVPEAEARDSQQMEIEELIQQSPIVSPAAIEGAMQQHADQVMAGGAPALPFDPSSAQPDQPSVPINDYDYHQWHAMKCQDWLNGDEARKQYAKGNNAGVMNVVLHWKAHVAAMAAMMPPPMPAAPGIKPPQPGGPPAAAAPPGGPPAMGPPGITM
jgi:hypothetical protein